MLPQSLYNIAQKEDQTKWNKEMIKSAKNKYGLTLSRLIKVYITEGTLEEQ